ncbi:MAG: YbjN domain-containing protein [Alphaproteobacteria bacterium]|nr:YbjN domain-containing protein [Alphaproteobacteria bacterium]
MNDPFDNFEPCAINPLDRVEDVLDSNSWVFNRVSDEELIVQVKGKYCAYRLFFIWQDDMDALQFCCQYDLHVTPGNFERAASVLMSINENLWMGHFDIPKDTRIPTFRKTSLFRGLDNAVSAGQIEDLVDISLAQCERFYTAFYLLSEVRVANDQTLTLALMDAKGES